MIARGWEAESAKIGFAIMFLPRAAAARASAVMVFTQNSHHHKTHNPHLTTVYAAGYDHAAALGCQSSGAKNALNIL